MIDVHEWVILLLVAALVAQDTTAGPQLLVSEPLVSGTLAGWVVGDAYLGLVMGLAVQLIWSGMMPVGTTLFLDVNVGVICAVVVAAAMPGSEDHRLLAMGVALLWMVPVALLGTGLTELHRRLSDIIVSTVRPESAAPRTIAWRHLGGWLLAGVQGMMTLAFGVALGMVIVPAVTHSLVPIVRADLLWAGILGTGGGMAVGVTWHYSRGRATLLGALLAAGFWALWTYAG